MKGTLLLLAAAIGLAAAQPAGAQYVRWGEPAYAGGMPPSEVYDVIRAAGLSPLTAPMWIRGRYVIRAVDRRGQEFRLVVDSHYGEIVSAMPVVRTGYFDERPIGYGPGPRVMRMDPPAMALPSDVPVMRTPPAGAQIDPDQDEATALPPPDAEPRVIMAPRNPGDLAMRSESAPHVNRALPSAPATPPLPRPRPVSKQTVPSNAQASLASANPAPTAAPQAATPKPAETKTAAEVKKPEPAAAGKAVDWPPVQPLDDTSKSKLRL